MLSWQTEHLPAAFLTFSFIDQKTNTASVGLALQQTDRQSGGLGGWLIARTPFRRNSCKPNPRPSTAIRSSVSFLDLCTLGTFWIAWAFVGATAVYFHDQNGGSGHLFPPQAQDLPPKGQALNDSPNDQPIRYPTRPFRQRIGRTPIRPTVCSSVDRSICRPIRLGAVALEIDWAAFFEVFRQRFRRCPRRRQRQRTRLLLASPRCPFSMSGWSPPRTSQRQFPWGYSDIQRLWLSVPPILLGLHSCVLFLSCAVSPHIKSVKFSVMFWSFLSVFRHLFAVVLEVMCAGGIDWRTGWLTNHLAIHPFANQPSLH